VHWAPGIPHALFWGGDFLHNPGAMRRGIAAWRLEHRFNGQAFAHHAPGARLALPSLVFTIIAVPDIESCAVAQRSGRVSISPVR